MQATTRSAPLPDFELAELTDLAEHVERSVETRTGGRIRGLSVKIADGRMVITGRTSTYYNKQLVTHAALDAAVANCAVHNEVEVC